MAVIQISRIQNRRGLLNELPNALAEGEIGMTLDTGELFIGAENFPPIANRSTFPYQNIQLLTEFSLASLAERSLSYTYRYQDPDHPLFPGSGSFRATSSYTVERLLQERLDEVVSVKAYGATGNGTTDDTVAIRNACADLYNPLTGKFRTLYFPAGTYLVTSPIYLYPRSNWVGDGIDKSIITLAPEFTAQGNLNPTVDTLPVSPSALDLYNIVTTTGDFGGSLGFTVSPGDQLFYGADSIWALVTSAYKTVVETVNSDGNTDGNIDDFTDGLLATNSLPEDISVQGISFHRNTTGDVLRLNRASRAFFNSCRFDADFDPLLDSVLIHGDFASSTSYNSTRHGICVRIDSLSTLVASVLESADFTFNACEFVSNTYAFYTTDDITNVNVISSRFENLFKAASLGEGCITAFQDDTGDLTVPSPYVATDDFGPANFRIIGSTFKNIMDTPFSVYSTRGGNMSAYNRYADYGQGVPVTPVTPTAPAVFFYADHTASAYTNENTSLGDTFDYTGTDLPTDTALRVRNISSRNSIINNQDHQHFKNGVGLGESYINLPMEPVNNRIVAGQVDYPTGIKLSTADPQRATDVIIDYSITRGNGKRKGQIHVLSDGLDIEWTESYSEFGDPILMTFSVANTSSQNFRVKYTDDAVGGDLNDGVDAYVRWTATHWWHAFDDEGYTTAIDDEIDITGTSGSEDWGLITDTPAIEFADYDLVSVAVTEQQTYGTVI